MVALLLAGSPAGHGETEYYDEMELMGNARFILQVQSSLHLLMEKAPDEYAMVKKYIKIIKLGEKSGMWAHVNPPIYVMSEKSAYASITWCASIIAHDSYHSKLYHEYESEHPGYVPAEVWTGVEAERRCNEHQLKVLEKIGAPGSEIEYLKSLDGTHFDVDKDGNYHQQDYDKRNW